MHLSYNRSVVFNGYSSVISTISTTAATIRANLHTATTAVPTVGTALSIIQQLASPFHSLETSVKGTLPGRAPRQYHKVAGSDL